MEVQVANDNALHWQGSLIVANESNAKLRTQLYAVRGLLRELASEPSGLNDEEKARVFALIGE